MYLKSLKLVGFKSFADRTRLELRPGVSVIVGPNGSGKSNIVDAVAWVMGTRSPKSLRTNAMEDVIFAGTATRPGLGRAEVTITLDNESGMLPLDLPEVSITRRLFRDGSSDYEINGVACRLLDVEELLSDSGVGRHQHVIIGQGQIDSILSATPDDHRAVIEEAAGILKHRVRKDKAIRRLERTDADVVRLRDLLAESARQMRPLKRQAAAAERHAGLVAEARGLRLFLAGEELRRIRGRRSDLASSARADESALATAQDELERLGRELTELRHAAGDVGERLEADSGAAARIETTLERLHRIAQVARERHRAGIARMENAGARQADLQQELEDLERELAALEPEAEEARTAAERAERAFRALEEEERSLADQEGMSAEGAVAVVRGDLRSLEAADRRDTREEESLAVRVASLRGQLDDEMAEIARLNDEIRDLDASAAGAQEAYEKAKSARAGEQERWEAAETALNRASVERAAAAARLEAVIEAAQGLADPDVRAGVEAAPGAVGSLSALLDVPERLAGAVDAALGVWADAVVFEGRSSLEQAVGDLKGSGLGGVPMVSPAPAAGQVSATRDAARAWGLEALVDLLGGGADGDLATAILGDVVLAEGWHAAREFVARNPSLRVVTPEGDLVSVHGVRVAHPEGATPAMIEAAAVSLERAEREEARCRSLHTQARRGFEDARAAEREALETLEAIESSIDGAGDALSRLERSAAAVRVEMERLSDRRASLASERAERAARRGALEVRLSALEGEEAERQRAWEELVSRREEVSVRREEARARWQDDVAAHRATSERHSLLTRRREAVSSALDREDGAPDDPLRLDRLKAIEDAARRTEIVLRDHLEVLRRRQSALRERAGETGRRIGEVQQGHDERMATIAETRERLSTTRVEEAELRVREEAVAEGLRREADASEDEALAAPRPDVEPGTDLSDLLATREAELRRMGPVNPLAAGEYAELSERHEFLTAQLDDLQGSRDELAKVISALDAEIETQFREAFDEVAAAYQRNFEVLFPGGRGRLRLSDPDAPLSSGVEIEAQPLGKRVASMSLLSGGERSLAALSFLFAVFEARPSPFYLLDEVEAALDDANLRRFLRLLDRFREDAQLVVITHQQQTMEAADVLYGVTMEPGGSSRAVAKPLVPVESRA